MQLTAITVQGEMGEMTVQKVNRGMVKVTRENGETTVVSEYQELAVAIDGVNFQNAKNALRIAELLGVELY